MKKTIKNIYLTWRTGKGDRRIPIGRIKKNSSEGIIFSYFKNNVEEAKKLGFVPFEGFPDIDKIYTSNVLEIFGHRLIKNERSDSKYFYDFWMIEKDRRDDVFYLLAMTQGLVPTDNFEFLADFYPTKNLCFITEISGLSKQNIDSKLLEDNDILVRIQYNKRTIYELRNSNDVKKVSITSRQFDNLKERLNFNHLKSEGLGVRKHYYKR